MTSVAYEPNDDAQPSSPELARVDPSLAERLRAGMGEAASEPEPEPAPEPEPPLPPLAVVPAPEPDPEPEPEPEPNVVELSPAEPRDWNVWELERRAREQAGVDVARDEEWGYLLLYLREFASAEGTLPRDFDALVRESFGELIASP